MFQASFLRRLPTNYAKNYGTVERLSCHCESRLPADDGIHSPKRNKFHHTTPGFQACCSADLAKDRAVDHTNSISGVEHTVKPLPHHHRRFRHSTPFMRILNQSVINSCLNSSSRDSHHPHASVILHGTRFTVPIVTVQVSRP